MFLMDRSYLMDLAMACVKVHSVEGGGSDIIVYGGDGVIRKEFVDLLERYVGEGVSIIFGGKDLSSVLKGEYGFGLGYYLKRRCFPEIGDTRFRDSRNPVEVCRVRVTSLKPVSFRVVV